MICFPNAKINIGLNILSRRDDGYHNLESIFFPIKIQDALEVIENKKFEKGNTKVLFTSSGIEIPGTPEGNLVIKAFQLLDKEYNLPPVKIHLLKNIPIGAGLGGGSSDGAFSIKLFNEKFDLKLSAEKMRSFAEELGSDCPFFINNLPVFVSGRGEVLEPINLNIDRYYLVLINPGIHVGTKDAYEMITPAIPSGSLRDLIKRPMNEWKNSIKNDFEAPLLKKYPLIKEIKEKFYDSGALYASMTGSGSSVYGIFEKETEVMMNEKFFKWSGLIGDY